MTLLQLRTYVREQADDTIAPFLWSDATLNILLNEAQVEACRRARLIKDSTTDAVTLLTLLAGTSLYTVDPRVIFIRRMKLSTLANPLGFKRTRDMDEQVPGWEAHTGSVSQWITDYNSGKVRFYRNPDATAVGSGLTARMTVVRGPLVDMSADGDIPEIAPRFHVKLHHWALYRMFSKQDSEVYDAKIAADNKEQFTAEFGPPSSAIEENWIDENFDYAEDSGIF